MTSGGGFGGEADTVFIDLTARIDGFEQQLAELERKAKETGDKAGKGFGGAMSAGMALAATGAVALAGSLAAVAASSINLAQESAANVNQLQAQLGLTREEAESLGDVALEVFANNFGGSLEEAGQMVANVRQQIQGLSNEELQSVTEASATIADVFQEDQATVAQAIASVMEATGASVQEATDFIAAGFQNGLNASEDFLDTLNEYAPQFAKAGVSAEELYSLLETGSAKGVLGTDKIADAFKEFSLRAADGAKATGEAFEQIGMSQAEVEEQLRSGETTYAELFQTVTDKLQDVQNEADRTNIIGALFGGAGEDLGKGLAQLDMTQSKMQDMAGAADSLAVKYSDLGSFMGGMWRQVQKALLPVGEELLALANEAAPYLQATFERVGPQIAQAITKGVAAAKEFGAVAVNVYNTVQPPVAAAWNALQKVSAAIQRNREVLIPLTAGIAAGTAAYGAYRAAIVAVTAVKAAWTAATTAATAASVALRAAITFLTGPVGIAITVITALVSAGVYLYRNWDTLGPKARAAWNTVRATIENAMNTAVTFLRGLPAKMVQIGVDIAMGLVNGVKSRIASVGQAAKEMGQAAWAGVKSFLRIQSPSRVMHELGEFVGEGFVNGIGSKNAKVKQAAQEMARAFTDSLSELKMQQDLGLVDLDTYIKTLQKAEKQLRAKVSAVKEGTPAYREYLSALSNVTRELESATGKSASLAKEAGEAARKIKEAQEKIRADEAYEQWAESLKGMKDAELEGAKATAFAAGNTRRYNAVKAEQERRIKAVKDALEAEKEAERKLEEQRQKNIKTIREREDWADFLKMLEGMETPDLRSLQRITADSGDIDVYNAVTKQLEQNGKGAAGAVADLASELEKDKGQPLAAYNALTSAIADLDENTTDGAAALAILNDELEELEGRYKGWDFDELNRWVEGGSVGPAESGPVAAVPSAADRRRQPVTEKEVEQVRGAVAATKEWSEEWQKLQDKLGKDRILEGWQEELDSLDFEGLQGELAEAFKNRDFQRLPLILEEIASREEEAEGAAESLADMQRELSGAVAEVERPFGKQIKQLEEMREAPDAATEEIDELLAAYRKMQAEAEEENKLVGQINKWSNYAEQMVPVAIGAFEAIGGMSEEVAGQWGQDLSSMVSDISSFAKSLASGDYFGAAVQGLTTIFNWLNRNKRAAQEAAKEAADYNAQFRFSQNGYGTRTVETYTTGVFLWETTHYKETIDEAGQELALSLEGGFVNGIEGGMKEALKANDFSVFEKSLRQSVGDAVLDGLIDAFMNEAVLGDIIGPAIQEYLQTGDVGVLENAVVGATAVGEQLYNDLQTIRDRLNLSGPADGGAGGNTALFGNAPSVQLGIPRLEVSLPPVLTEGLDAFATTIPVFDRATHRLLEAAELIIAGHQTGGPPPATGLSGLTR